MMAVLDWRIFFVGCEVFFIIQCGSSELSPPQYVKVESSVLTWDRPKDPTVVAYVVQYNWTQNDWHEVYAGPQQKFNFTASAEDFYGKTFRVRSERQNQTSVWVLSKLVQCAHLHTCAPIMELKVERDKVHMWMKHRDQSLKDKEGEHIIFRPLYWKRNCTDKQELPVNSAHLVLEDLESGQEYCFQVEYLLYHQPHGKPSHQICEVIPETTIQRTRRVILIGVLTVVGFFTLVFCVYYIYTHYKRIKTLLQPPLDIPDHIEEFFSSEFFPQSVALPGNQVTESIEFVSFVHEAAEDEDRCDMEHDKENADSP